MLAEATITYYVTFIREFLADRFGRGRVTFARLCAGDIVRFVQRQASRLHPKRAKQLTTALRAFLHYARHRGDITEDLVAAVPCVANWSMPSFPRGIPAESVRQLLTSIDRKTARGRRDYAILLALCQGGPRCVTHAGVALARRGAMTTLRSAVHAYLVMRRDLGFHLREAGRLLLQFVMFMEQHRASIITTRLALTWAQQPQTVQPAEWARRLSIVRIFARYRRATDPRTEIPPDGLLPYRPKRARPYPYSAQLYLQKGCTGCHGRNGSMAPAPTLIKSDGTMTNPYPCLSPCVNDNNVMALHSPYATVLWDYINRGMPLGKEQTLKPDEVYALTAFLLFKNNVIKEDDVMDAQSLPTVVMPNRNGHALPPEP